MADSLDRVADTATARFVDRLTKVYDDGTHALDALELRLPAGSFFGLLGPNGAGKTTLIGSVVRLVRAPADRIFVFGYDAVAVFIAADVLSSLNVNHASQETCSDFDTDAVPACYEQIGDLRSSM